MLPALGWLLIAFQSDNPGACTFTLPLLPLDFSYSPSHHPHISLSFPLLTSSLFFLSALPFPPLPHISPPLPHPHISSPSKISTNKH